MQVYIKKNFSIEMLIQKLLIISVILFLSPTIAFSLGADTAHPYITKEGIKVWPGDIKDPNAIGPKEAVEEFDRFKGKLEQGSHDEDYPYYPSIIATGMIGGFWKHYEDPLKWWAGANVPNSEPAIDWTVKLFNRGVEEYSKGNTDTAYYFLGRVAHMIGDAATPAHMHNDVHSAELFGVPVTIDKAARDPDLFELYMDTHLTYTYSGTAPNKASISEIFTAMMNEAKKYPSNDAGEFWKFDWEWKITVNNIFYKPIIPPPQIPPYIETIPIHHIRFKILSSGGILTYGGWGTYELISITPYLEVKIKPTDIFFFQLSDNLDSVRFEYSIYKDAIENSSALIAGPLTETYTLASIRENRGIDLQVFKISIDTVDISSKTEKECEEIADDLMPQAISYTASLYKLFWSSTGIPPYVQDVRVYEGGELRYHVYWEDVFDEMGKVIKREKKIEERWDGSVVADAFGGEEEDFGLGSLDRKWVKYQDLEEGGEGVELEFEITFSQAVSEVKEVTFGLCPPYKPDEGGKSGKKVECSSLEGNVWSGKVRILPEDIATKDEEEKFEKGPLEKIIYRKNKEGSIRGGNVLRIVGGKNSRGMEIDSDPTTVARIVTNGSGQKVWEGYEAITTILCPALTEEFFPPCEEGIPDIEHTVLTNEHPELEGLPLEERYHQDRNHRIYLGDTYVKERVIRDP